MQDEERSPRDNDKFGGEEDKIKAGGPGPQEAAGSAAEPKNKVRRTNDTVEPVTWHGTAPDVWDEILNIAGANNPFPKLVVELVPTDDVWLTFACQRMSHTWAYASMSSTRSCSALAWLRRSSKTCPQRTPFFFNPG